MNFRLVCKLLGLVALLIGVTMIFSLPWAFPSLGWRRGMIPTPSTGFEADGFFALVGSILASGVVGALLIGIGRKSTGALYHREAMAVVGLTWLMATVLGGLPFYLSGTHSGPSIRLGDTQAHVYLYVTDWWRSAHWQPKYQLSYNKHQAIVRIVDAGPRGISAEDAQDGSGKLLHELADGDADFRRVLRFPGDPGFKDRVDRYRVLWTKMSFIDAMFESQSGFSTTGATVISELEDPQLVPRCILFWRSSTHFLGGLGIIVLFVAILGQGSAGKALMRNEVPGPSQEGSQARMQQTAWIFASIYLGQPLIPPSKNDSLAKSRVKSEFFAPMA